MKKKWIEYHSEDGDIWELLVDTSYVENENDKISDFGNHAVLRKVSSPADYVVVSILPSARIVDDVKNQIGKEKLFYIKLHLMNEDDWFCISEKSYTKNEIIKISNLFIGINKLQAEKIWNLKKLGKLIHLD